jgi:hypothetical protein
MKQNGMRTHGDCVLIHAISPFQDTGAVVGRVATGLSIIAGYPLVFSGLRESAASLLSGAGLPSFRSLRSGSLAWTSLTLLLLAMASGIALVAKDVGIVVSCPPSSLALILGAAL